MYAWGEGKYFSPLMAPLNCSAFANIVYFYFCEVAYSFRVSFMLLYIFFPQMKYYLYCFLFIFPAVLPQCQKPLQIAITQQSIAGVELGNQLPQCHCKHRWSSSINRQICFKFAEKSLLVQQNMNHSYPNDLLPAYFKTGF